MRLQVAIVVCALSGLWSCSKQDSSQHLADAAQQGSDASSSSADAAAPAPDAMAPDQSGLILYYEFEGSGTTVTDSSSRGKDGMLSDAAAWTADGRIGRGLALSGDSPATRYVSLPDGVLTGVGDFSIAFWVKLNTVAAWARVYDIGNGKADPDNRFMYFTPNGFLGATNGVHASSYGGSAANELAVNSGTQLPTGVWKHVTITGSGGDRTVYIDGFPAITETGGPVVPPAEMEPISSNSWIGKSRFPDPGLDGTIDDFRIYNRVLSAKEAEDLAWPNADYSYWRFDGGTGTTAADSSDNAIPTVLGDGVTWTTGRLGGAIDFAGGAAGDTGPTVTLAGNPLANCTDELTVSAWVKLRSLTAWSRIFDFGTGTTAFVYLAPTDGTGMHFAMVSPAGVFDLVSASPPVAADDTWHNVAVTVDAAGLVTMYADGAAIASGTSADVHPSDFAGATDLWLGKSRFPDPYLDGSIDELRIGCRALTADEIKNLAQPPQ